MVPVEKFGEFVIKSMRLICSFVNQAPSNEFIPTPEKTVPVAVVNPEVLSNVIINDCATSMDVLPNVKEETMPYTLFQVP